MFEGAPIKAIPGKEFEDLYPTCLYGKSKIEIEKTLRDLYINSNLRYITLRPTNVYGNFCRVFYRNSICQLEL